MSSLLTRPRRRPELNLVPLIDVLVMLIFFAFVTMQFKSATTLHITLPKITSAGKNEVKDSVTIAVEKEGTLSFNGKVILDDQLESLLKQVSNANPDIPVLIKADENSQVKKLAFLINACTSARLLHFQLESRN